MTIKLIIMARACRIRMQRGELLEDIMASYTVLTEDDKAQLRAAIIPESAAESGVRA